MTSFNDTFKRIEKKYRLSAEQYDALRPYLDQHMQVDEYGKSTITSLYLDTADYSLICRSLEKPLYKEKLRVRYYGDLRALGSMSPVFLEIKRSTTVWSTNAAFVFPGLQQKPFCLERTISKHARRTP